MNWKHLLLAAALAAPSVDAAIIANWLHDELSGSLIDSTSNHPAGVPTGTPAYGLPGVPNGTYGALTIGNAFGTAIEYGPTAVDEFFNVGTDNNNPVLNLDTTGSFTVMAWMNPYALISATPRSYKVLSTGSAAGVDRGWGLALRLTQIDGTASSIRFTSFGIVDNDSLTFSVTFGAWIHVATTYNNGPITYFLNGNMLDTDTSSFGNESANGRLVVGSRLGGNDSDQMNGKLDGVRVYDQVLTEAEIRQAAVDSVSGIPEPSVALIGLAGTLGLVCRRRRRLESFCQ
jgi:Concanavalin A-like lectin/glucanases superfamily